MSFFYHFGRNVSKLQSHCFSVSVISILDFRNFHDILPFYFIWICSALASIRLQHSDAGSDEGRCDSRQSRTHSAVLLRGWFMATRIFSLTFCSSEWNCVDFWKDEIQRRQYKWHAPCGTPSCRELEVRPFDLLIYFFTSRAFLKIEWNIFIPVTKRFFLET